METHDSFKKFSHVNLLCAVLESHQFFITRRRYIVGMHKFVSVVPLPHINEKLALHHIFEIPIVNYFFSLYQ